MASTIDNQIGLQEPWEDLEALEEVEDLILAENFFHFILENDIGSVVHYQDSFISVEEKELAYRYALEKAILINDYYATKEMFIKLLELGAEFYRISDNTLAKISGIYNLHAEADDLEGEFSLLDLACACYSEHKDVNCLQVILLLLTYDNSEDKHEHGLFFLFDDLYTNSLDILVDIIHEGKEGSVEVIEHLARYAKHLHAAPDNKYMGFSVEYFFDKALEIGSTAILDACIKFDFKVDIKQDFFKIKTVIERNNMKSLSWLLNHGLCNELRDGSKKTHITKIFKLAYEAFLSSGEAKLFTEILDKCYLSCLGKDERRLAIEEILSCKITLEIDNILLILDKKHNRYQDELDELNKFHELDLMIAKFFPAYLPLSLDGRKRDHESVSELEHDFDEHHEPKRMKPTFHG